jgi:hypothetical protein
MANYSQFNFRCPKADKLGRGNILEIYSLRGAVFGSLD